VRAQPQRERELLHRSRSTAPCESEQC
jgi:hypothetical protein